MVKAGVIGFCTLLSLASPVVAQQQVYAVMWGSSQLGVVTFDPQTNPATGAVLSSDLEHCWVCLTAALPPSVAPRRTVAAG